MKILNKIKIFKNSIVFGSILLLGSHAQSASIFFDNSTFAVRDSSGTRITNSSDFLAAYGWFNTGFTPTTNNVSSWLSNFYGVSGYHKFNSTSSENTISAGITLGFNPGPDNSPDDGTYDYLAKIGSSQGGSIIGLASVGTLLPENTAFNVIIWNASTASAATEAAIFSGSGTAWRITSQFDVETPDIVELSGQTTITSVLTGGLSTTSGSRFVQMVVIPEPSTGALLLLGAASSIFFRPRRRSLNTTVSLFVSLLILGSFGVQAQSTVSTPIVGFQTVNLGVGMNSVGFPLLNSDTVKTTASSLSGNAVTLSGETNFGSKLDAAKSYYIEVYSGSLKGDRFDLDTTATVNAANGTAVLNSSSANNTLAVSSIGSSLNGETVAIRPHITLSQIETMASTPLLGSSSLSSSDGVAFTEGGVLVYYFKKADGTWRRTGSSADFSAKVIAPGTGVFIKKATSSSSLTQTGTVRQNDFSRPYGSGVALISAGFPLDRSVVQIGMVPGAGTTDWFGGTAATGDSVSVYENGVLVKYTLKSDGSLTKVGSSTDFKNSALITSSSSQFLKRSKANADNIEINPVP